jgi:hypothetical protein
MKLYVTIGKFGEDDTADIKVDDHVVGWLERVRGERFASASSRARVSYVSHYSIVLTDDAADDQLKKHDVASRAEARLEVERAVAAAAALGPAERNPVPGYSNYGGGGPFAPMGAPRQTKTRTR